MSSSIQLESVAAASPVRRRLGGIRAFGLICLGQVVSLFGAHLASFVIGVWVFRQTGSATDFSLISFFSVLPEIALAPLAGVVVDLWGRQEALVAGSFGAGLCAAALALLAGAGKLTLWAIYLIVSLSSAFQSVQFPALSSVVTILVPKAHLSRANGIVELGNSLAMVAAPLAAGAALYSIGLNRVLWCSAVAYALALLTLALVRIEKPAVAVRANRQRRTIIDDALEGWKYVVAHRELRSLLLFIAIANFITAVVQVLLPPLVLSFASAQALGKIMSAGGVGVVLGSMYVTIRGGSRSNVRVILYLTLFQGLILFAGVLQPSVLLVGAAVFAFLFCDPIAFTSSQTIWQTKVPVPLQGRAFAIRRVLAWSAMPVAYLAAGPLADRVFEPLMRNNGPLAGSVGLWIGSGPGRGIALLFVLLGVLTLCAAIAGFGYRPLCELEMRLPDSGAGSGSDVSAGKEPATAGGEES